MSGETLRWERQAFLSDQAPGAPCPAVVDLTGRARYPFFGPYVALAPGLWRATARLEVCPEAARRSLALQFGVEPDYTTTDLPRGTAGPVTVTIDHAFSGEGLAQVRLWLKKAAFHGEVRLLGVDLRRLDPDSLQGRG